MISILFVCHGSMVGIRELKKLALLLVGAAELFDVIKLQYQLILNFFHLEDVGMVL